MTEMAALQEVASPIVNSGGAVAAIGVFTWFMKASVIPHLEKKDQYIRGIVADFNNTVTTFMQKSILAEEQTREALRHYEEKAAAAEKSSAELTHILREMYSFHAKNYQNSKTKQK